MSAIVEQPLETRSFVEQTPQGYERTVFHISNPLQQKKTPVQLRDTAALSQKDRYAWIDAQMKKLLPEKFYKLVVDSQNQSDRKKAADMMAQADTWMRNNRIQIVHPGNQSLQTYIYVKGQIVAEYELRLDTI